MKRKRGNQDEMATRTGDPQVLIHELRFGLP
eukprot:CAMPEP_0194041892 /NCGR_PEP_ID=MMETSP0009_2-20130614/13698_1 /TAXON_ID=210454 /ORGANISM="Grammatophora oceanica, Strain CCMP 410" /LENGTH=30 /DNA_ID= /DNA_START= /DNA_END= /DNA_ORIENTATION=